MRFSFGEMRYKAFLIKDAYSFDKTNEDIKITYSIMKDVK